MIPLTYGPNLSIPTTTCQGTRARLHLESLWLILIGDSGQKAISSLARARCFPSRLAYTSVPPDLPGLSLMHEPYSCLLLYSHELLGVVGKNLALLMVSEGQACDLFELDSGPVAVSV